MSLESPKLTISIYLRGDQLRPNTVSEVLGVEPSGFQTKGSLRPGSKVIAKTGVWRLTAQTHSRVATDHIDELLREMETRRTPLDQIEGVEDAYLDIFVALDYENGTQERVSFLLTMEHMTRLTQLGLSVQFTVA